MCVCLSLSIIKYTNNTKGADRRRQTKKERKKDRKKERKKERKKGVCDT